MADPGRGEVQVVVGGSGVCGSNLPVWEGRPWFSYPLPPGAPGHEAWGRIAAVGEGVEDRHVGEPVAFLGEAGFASHAVVPASSTIVLPPELAGEVFPGEALGCAFNVAARCGFRPDQRVCVVGVGFLGAIVTHLAAQAGAQVIAVSRRGYALDVATAMGAKDTVQLESQSGVVDAVAKLTGGELCEVVVEAVGAQGPLDLAGELTGVRGRLVIAGFHQDGPRTVDLQLWNWRGIDVVNAHERDPAVSLAGMEAAATAVAGGTFDPAPLYSSYPLERLGDALDDMVRRPDGFMKAVVRP
ncbi:MAG TPA: zinc-binding dehydrogenase [Acidimicrobiales bacterium]|nr:zinc-binding dehydrogenase [Acidimicrobiales bacterium]